VNQNYITKSDNKEKPLVTVCIATCNRSNVIEVALKSVIGQKYGHLDVVIVDDFSNDETKELIEKYSGKDNRIRYFRHDRNEGLAAARNTAIFNAKGKYFTFIDDDDQWDPQFVESFADLAERYEERWCFCCGQRFINKKGLTTYIIPEMDGNLIDYIRKGYTPPTSAQFYSTSMLRKVGGYDERIKSGVDHDLWLTLAFNNCYIKSINGCLSFFGSDVAYGRITGDITKRRGEIELSLDIWKEKIVKHEGNEFYSHFVKSYRAYLDVMLFTEALKKRNLLSALKIFIRNDSKKYIISYVANLFLGQLKRYIKSSGKLEVKLNSYLLPYVAKNQ